MTAEHLAVLLSVGTAGCGLVYSGWTRVVRPALANLRWLAMTMATLHTTDVAELAQEQTKLTAATAAAHAQLAQVAQALTGWSVEDQRRNDAAAARADRVLAIVEQAGAQLQHLVVVVDGHDARLDQVEDIHAHPLNHPAVRRS